MFITSFEEQNITYRSCSNLRIHLSIADVFAIRQEKCRVHGQKGWAYFSKKDSVYERTSPTDTVIYLWAYSRGNNSYIGNVTGGEKIGALIVEKKK